MAQSSAEAEYYAAVSAANEGIWLKQLLLDLGFSQQTIIIKEDNQACIALTKNPEDHKRTKHVQVKYHVVRDYVNKNIIKFVYVQLQISLEIFLQKQFQEPNCELCLRNSDFLERGRIEN